MNLLAAGTYTEQMAIVFTVPVTVTVTVTGSPTTNFPNNINVPPLPPPAGVVVNVATESALQSAVNNLKSNQTIVLAAGVYNLTDTLYIPQGITNVGIRGATGKASDVTINGLGMSGSINFGIWVGNSNPVFADFTLKGFKQHGIILNAGVQSPLFHNLHIVDIGTQFIKSNPDGLGGGVNNGIVEYCTLEYTTTAPGTYTNGVDVHTGVNWIIRNNVFKNFRSSAGLTGPVVLMWNKSKNTITDSNTFINNARDIGYGLEPAVPNDHTGGIIRNNFITHVPGMGGDVPVGIFNSPGTELIQNTILLNGNYPNAVEYRFANTTGVSIKNNLTDALITSRNGATGTLTNNLTTAQAAWFVDASIGNLHLKPTSIQAISKIPPLVNASKDYDGQTRPTLCAYGADEISSIV